MKAEIRLIFSVDITIPLNDYKPDDNNNFSIRMQVMIGPKSGNGEESFDIHLCTPQWLIENSKKTDVIFGRHYLIVFEYDFEKIEKKLKSFVANIDEPTWDEVAQKLSRIGMWEFEDYCG